jgi:hypothetical protein
MQGSFTSDSADKFFQLMREAGYETLEVPSDGELQNFSSQGASAGSALGDVWQGNIAEFGEVRGEYLDVVDFTRCERPDGSAYGTSGKCKKGTEAEQPFKPDGGIQTGASGGHMGGALFGKGNVATTPGQDRVSALVKAVQDKNGTFRKLVWPSTKLTPPLKKKLQGLKATLKVESEGIYKEIVKLSGEKEGFLIKKPKNNSAKIEELRKQRDALYEAATAVNKKLRQPLKAQTKTVEFSEQDLFDYTRCARPDGSVYGTSGKCRKGVETTAKAAEPEKSERSLRTEAAGKINSLKTGIKETSDKIDKIVRGGGKVGLNDPLSKKLKKQVEQLKQLKRFEEVTSVAPIAPVPPKPIKDPVPGILRSQAEIKKIIADRPETPNPIRNAAGQPLNLTIARVKALSDQDLESEWNRAKTKGRKDKLQAELDRREAAVKATPKKETQSDRETRGEFARNAKDFQGRIKDIKDEIRRSADDPEMRKQIPALMKQMKMWEGKLEGAKAGSVKPGKN